MISIIIPTYNRADALEVCLQKLLAQTGVSFEIIVVDDGSIDNASEVVKRFTSSMPSEERGAKSVEQKKLTAHRSPLTAVQYIHQKNSGQATARNRGVQEAKGDIILFIGDDIWVEPNFLKRHWEAHQKHSDGNVVVVGYSTWNPPADWQANDGPKVEVNDYMKFLEASGWQFGYGFLKPGFVSHPQPYKFFYTSNISMKKSFFEKETFDESFKAYGWEDAELGYRLWKNHEMKLFYEPEAKAYHHHFIPESDLPKKMQTVGRSAVQFNKLHPELKIVPTGFKKWLIKIATNPITLPLTRLLGKQTYFKFKSWREFMKGVSSVKNEE